MDTDDILTPRERRFLQTVAQPSWARSHAHDLTACVQRAGWLWMRDEIAVILNRLAWRESNGLRGVMSDKHTMDALKAVSMGTHIVVDMGAREPLFSTEHAAELMLKIWKLRGLPHDISMMLFTGRVHQALDAMGSGESLCEECPEFLAPLMQAFVRGAALLQRDMSERLDTDASARAVELIAAPSFADFVRAVAFRLMRDIDNGDISEPARALLDRDAVGHSFTHARSGEFFVRLMLPSGKISADFSKGAAFMKDSILGNAVACVQEMNPEDKDDLFGATFESWMDATAQNIQRPDVPDFDADASQGLIQLMRAVLQGEHPQLEDIMATLRMLPDADREQLTTLLDTQNTDSTPTPTA